MKINNCRELWEGITGEKLDDEDRAKRIMEKSVFKYTDCGCVFGTDDRGIYVSGYAEGSDAELPMHYLSWGFTIEEYNTALDEADAEGVRAWNIANNDVELIEVEWPTKADTKNMITEEEWNEERNKTDLGDN